MNRGYGAPTLASRVVWSQSNSKQTHRQSSVAQWRFKNEIERPHFFGTIHGSILKADYLILWTWFTGRMDQVPADCRAAYTGGVWSFDDGEHLKLALVVSILALPV